MKTILTALLICVAILWISPAGFGLSESKYVRHVSTDDSTGSNVTLIIGTNSGTGRIWFGENTGEPGSRNKFRRISKHPDVDGLMSMGMSFVEDSGASVDTHHVALLVQEIRWDDALDGYRVHVNDTVYYEANIVWTNLDYYPVTIPSTHASGAFGPSVGFQYTVTTLVAMDAAEGAQFNLSAELTRRTD